ncbi:unnamed protein product [Adineta steineri]|uniref:RING-type domain-containing protein n=1 Tax=Adineta steineri TaxID=433720 RepID=A0A818K6E8_9BILA|nr:unnamed protein product [Adineta steineri]CAF1360981.1 unnamed protein product [Adineta steineri]CAF3553232.1 unnamed protein product [Adineta steineri]CAF3621070.1 unnamed protein product [Adineta steineri]
MGSDIGFEYMNEDSINHSLKCSICNQPFVHPVSTNCKKKHKFCRHCIEQWLKHNSSCPTCRRNLNSEDLISITEDIVVDVLNELRVKCIRCGKTDLERGDFNNHLKNSCLSAIVSCPAQDIKCLWTGHPNQLSSHLKHCTYQSLRPLIVSLFNENHQLKQHVTQLTSHIKEYQDDMKQLKEQLNQQATKIEGQSNEIIQLKNLWKQNGNQAVSVRNALMRGSQVATVVSQSQLANNYLPAV